MENKSYKKKNKVIYYNNGRSENDDIKIVDEEKIIKPKYPTPKKKKSNKNQKYKNNKNDNAKVTNNDKKILEEDNIIKLKNPNQKKKVGSKKNNSKENINKSNRNVNNKKKLIKNVDVNKKEINNIILNENDLIIKKKNEVSNTKNKLKKSRKRRLKKTIKIILVIIVIILISISSLIIGNNIYKENKRKQTLLSQQEYYELIKNSYNDYVTTINEADIYVLENNEFIQVFKANVGVNLYLNDTVEDYQDEYFKIKDTDYYIHYSSVKKIDEFAINQRYKSYIVFNENVVSKENFCLYDEDGKYVFSFNESYSFPIWIKYDNGYYVEYLDRLLFIKKDYVKEIVKKTNSTKKTTNKVKTFCYHQIHKENEKCNGSVYTCIPYKNFESHLNYLKENNYMTLTMKEMELFMDKKIQVPKKTVVITLDDGARSYNAANLAEEYQMYMTYFIITGTYNTTKLVHNDYIEYQSHTDSLHKNYRCSGGYQGGLLLCEKENTILKDLALSQEKLGGKDKVFAFAYPFYDYNDRAIKLLKQEGFRLGFIGLGGTNGYTTQGTDKMKIKRRTVWGNHTLKDFIKFVTT